MWAGSTIWFCPASHCDNHRDSPGCWCGNHQWSGLPRGAPAHSGSAWVLGEGKGRPAQDMLLSWSRLCTEALRWAQGESSGFTCDPLAPGSHPHCSSDHRAPAGAPAEAAFAGPGAQAPLPHMGDWDAVPGSGLAQSWLWPSPHLGQ